jgi:hypothetical protein
MRKTVIFFLTYEGSENKGNLFEKSSYSIFTPKSKIVNDFYNWVGNEMKRINKNDTCFISYTKIINL